MTTPLQAGDVVSRLLLLERRYRRLKIVVGLITLTVLTGAILAFTQGPPRVLEGQRLVLRGADGGYAEMRLVAPGHLQIRALSRTPEPDRRGAAWLSGSDGAGLELLGGLQPELVLTNAVGGEALRLAPGVRPLQR